MEYRDEMHLMEEYGLTDRIKKRMESFTEELKDNITQVNPAWRIIEGEPQEEEETCTVTDKSNNENEENENEALSESTQFYFTQVNDTVFAKQSPLYIQNEDIVECFYEELERSNGNLDLAQLEKLSEEELVFVISALRDRLSEIGTYNFCCTMNSMDLDQRARYSAILYGHFLLPKIIAMKEPSRLLSSAICESVKKFPDDIEKLIFIPLLTADIQDATIINVITTNFELQRKATLIVEFLMAVKELKAWHIPILQSLLSLKVDSDTKDKVLQLFLTSSFMFSNDKNFGKLVLSFIKTNSSFTKQQKELLWEIVSINRTFFKKPLENILKTL